FSHVKNRLFLFGSLGKAGVKQVKHKKGEGAKRRPLPIGNPTDSPAVRINWKFYRKELLLLIYEGEANV
ncbi:hypothetical protein, partial [Psychrobacillus sp. MER TA 171]|uniref:hypothetical protein n=1 Tax=Psychrobacillus sp. MER TA 171 TaxID=2939577 RepID=UPI00203CBD28